MGCKYWQQQISAAIDKKLTPEAEAKLLQHLHLCLPCADLYAWQKLLQEILRTEAPVKAPERFNQAVWQKLENVPVSSKKSFRWAPATLGALGLVAAAFAFVVVSNQWLQDKTIPTISPPPMMVEQPEALTPEPVVPEVMPIEPTLQRPQRAQEKALEEKVVNVVPQPSLEPEPKQAVKPEEERVEELPVPQVVKEEKQRKKTPLQQVRPRYSYKPPRLFRKRSLDKPTERENKKTAASSSSPAENQYQVQALQQVRLLRNKIHINRNEKTRLEFILNEPGQVLARVFSREGRLVKIIADLELPIGSHFVEWDGSTESGDKVASGIYMLVISGDIEEKRFKIAVIK